MRTYDRDLRTNRLPHEPHLPAGLQFVVVGYWILLGIGAVMLVATGWQWYSASRNAREFEKDVRSAQVREEQLRSVIGKLGQRRRLISNVETWLLDRSDLEALYHACAELASDEVVIQHLGIERKPESSDLAIRVVVEGASAVFTPFFRRLTSYLTAMPSLKIADIQMDMRPHGAVLSLDVHAEGFSAAMPASQVILTKAKGED